MLLGCFANARDDASADSLIHLLNANVAMTRQHILKLGIENYKL